MRPFVISHEYPDWFKPLLAEPGKRKFPQMERFADAVIETKSIPA